MTDVDSGQLLPSRGEAKGAGDDMWMARGSHTCRRAREKEKGW